MKIEINLPDNLPQPIVLQYLATLQKQLNLMGQLASENNLETDKARLKRGSAKGKIIFMTDNF